MQVGRKFCKVEPRKLLGNEGDTKIDKDYVDIDGQYCVNSQF